MKLVYTRLRPFAFLRKQVAGPYAAAAAHPGNMRGWLKGYSSEQTALLEGPFRRGNYVPELFRYRITNRTNRHVWPILHDKLFFHHFLAERMPLVPLLMAVIDGCPVPVSGGYTVERFRKELDGGATFVFKPLCGGGGTEMSFLNRNESGYRINNASVSLVSIEALIREARYHGLYPYMAQHPRLAELYPGTVNTIRVITAVDKERRPHIIAARLRIGTRTSEPVDNFERGAVVGRMDSESGLVTEVLGRDGVKGKKRYAQHPDTGAALEGVRVPYWEEARNLVCRFVEAHPYFDWVGWDLVIGPDGVKVLEGNHNPGLLTVFLFESLETMPEARRFLKERRIL